MAEPEQDAEATRRGIDRRGADRRAGDRRGSERRTPPPPWRRPWALVGYGVFGALAVVTAWNLATREERPPVQAEPVVRGSDTPHEVVDPPATADAREDAFGAAGFQRLMVDGEASVGRRVRTELFCGNASNFTIIQGHPVPRSVADLIREGRVPAAECKWGPPADGQSRPDFLLLIPPDLADDFSSAPVVTDNYVERRRLVAEVEWVGRSETLALRTGGVLRARASRP
jgi:hypothetical protein